MHPHTNTVCAYSVPLIVLPTLTLHVLLLRMQPRSLVLAQMQTWSSHCRVTRAPMVLTRYAVVLMADLSANQVKFRQIVSGNLYPPKQARAYCMGGLKAGHLQEPAGITSCPTTISTTYMCCCVLVQLPANKGAFETGCSDAFSVTTPPLGTITALTIGHNNKGMGAAWCLSRAELHNTQSGG